MPNKRPSELSNLVTTPSAGAVVMLDVPAPGESEQILVTNLIPPVPPTEVPASGNFLKSGGKFAHDGGLDIAVGASEYYIQGVLYTSPAAVVTADAADATNPRIDAVVLNSSGVAAIVTGTPAASPVRPEIDPATQLELTFITIAALATEPEIDVEPLYLENTEWTFTPSAGSIDPDDTTGERSGTKAIKITAGAAGANFKLVDGAPYDIAAKSQLAMWINPVTWVAQKQLQVRCYLSNVAVGNIVTIRDGVFGFIRTTASYQLVAIPTSLFGLAGVVPDEVRWTIAGGSTALTCFIDDITLQGGYDPVVSRGMINPMTTVGDIIIGGTDGAPTRLAAGTSTHVLTSNGPGTAPSYQAPAGVGGSKTLGIWQADEGISPGSNPATFDVRNSRPVMDFDDTTSESLLYFFKIPEGADLSAGIRVITEWKATSATTGNIGTSTSFERGNTDVDSDSFAAAQDSAGVAVNGTSGISVFVTTDHDETEIDGLAAEGESGYLKVARNTGISGNHTGDAELVSVEIQQLA